MLYCRYIASEVKTFKRRPFVREKHIEGPTYARYIASTPTVYISICISTLSTQHTKKLG